MWHVINCLVFLSYFTWEMLCIYGCLAAVLYFVIINRHKNGILCKQHILNTLVMAAYFSHKTIAVFFLITWIHIGSYIFIVSYEYVSIFKGSEMTIIRDPHNEKYGNMGVWNDTGFEKIAKLDMFIKNAYYDYREPEKKLIRVWALVPRWIRRDPVCHITYGSGRGLQVGQVKAYVRLWDEVAMPYCKYKTGVVECPWQGALPLWVSISASHNLTNRWHHVLTLTFQQLPSKMAICLKTLFDADNSDAGPLIEWFEFNKLLGVDKVILYGYSNVSTDIVDILKHYESIGYLEIIRWTLPVKSYTRNIFSSKDKDLQELAKKMENVNSNITGVRIHAQHLNYMDCVYRHMHDYKYLIMTDRDEIIIPQKHSSLKALMDHLDNTMLYKVAASFLFEEACFQRNPELVKFGNIQLELLSFGEKRVQRPTRHLGHHAKMIVKPRLVTNVAVHGIFSNGALQVNKPEVFVKPYLAKMHHFRNSARCKPFSVVDNSTRRFRHSLVVNIKNTVRKIYT